MTGIAAILRWRNLPGVKAAGETSKGDGYSNYEIRNFIPYFIISITVPIIICNGLAYTYIKYNCTDNYSDANDKKCETLSCNSDQEG